MKRKIYLLLSVFCLSFFALTACTATNKNDNVASPIVTDNATVAPIATATTSPLTTTSPVATDTATVSPSATTK